jgi:hypothetical protein
MFPALALDMRSMNSFESILSILIAKLGKIKTPKKYQKANPLWKHFT